MHPPRSGHQPAARGYGFTPALVRQQLLAPSPPPPNLHAQHQARASARYHDQLRVMELASGIRPYAARQDGSLALQAQTGVHAQRQYHVALTNYRSQRRKMARQLADLLSRPAVPTAVIRPAERRTAAEQKEHDREVFLYLAHKKYVEGVELISGEFAPLVLYDPVIKSTAEGGLMAMGGVAVGAAMPAGLRWLGTGVGAFRAKPWQVIGAAGMRGVLDASGQYGAGLIQGKGSWGAFNEINWVETGMSTMDFNPYFVAVASAGFSWSRKDKYQSIFESEASGHHISTAKFLTQASVGMAIGHFGGKLEHRLLEHKYRAWRAYAMATLMNTPRWGQPTVGLGLRIGQAYGTPLVLGVIEETGEGVFGDGVDNWWKNPNARPEAPTHPDSPVFLDNSPRP